MSPARPSVFLERRSYRRRRLADAARMMPFLGAVLFAVPLLWPLADAPEVLAGDVQPVSMSGAMLYIFVVWFGLVVLGAALGRLSHGLGDSADDGPG